MLDRLTIERLEAAAGEGPVLIALSGGGDSVALLHLFAERFGAARVRAAVVDHALRAGSAEDAQRAAAFAAEAGVVADILTLHWPDGPKRAQASARAARYGALCAHARAIGACVIAVGHTRDDQAETVLLRAARESGWRGLAAMQALAPAPLWPEGRGLWLARPLLHARRDDLRAWLRERGAAWIEDPANTNADFARVRARAALASAGLDPMRFAAIAERLSAFARDLDEAALALIDAAVSFQDDVIVLDPAAWSGAAQVRARALSVLIAAAGAAQRAPDVSPELTGTFTLAGALVRHSKSSVRISRDPGALHGRADGTAGVAALALEPGKTVVWDARLALKMMEPGWVVAAEASGPVLLRGQERRSVAASDAKWLLRVRVEHLLGRINANKGV